MRCISQKELDTRPSPEGDGEGHQTGSSPGDQNGGSTGRFTGGTNVGLALFIAGLYDYGQLVISTIISYMLLGSVMGILYAIWCKRQMAKKVKIA